jgi:hypothetical protein
MTGPLRQVTRCHERRSLKTASTIAALIATATNEISGRPPSAPSDRIGAKSWNAYPTSPHEKPPKGQRASRPSPRTQTLATSSGWVRPRRANRAMTHPIPAQYSASTATNGNSATAPKYHAHDTRTM